MSVRGRPRKPDHSQDEEKKQHIFTIRKGVFVSFQRCKTLGVDHLVEMGQIKTIIFSEKKGSKTHILVDTVLDKLTSELAWTQNFKSIASYNMFPEKFGIQASKWPLTSILSDRRLLEI